MFETTFETTEYGAAFTTMAVIKKTGDVAGVADTDFLTPAEIRAALKQRDPDTSLLLEAFLAAFEEWYDITKTIAPNLHDDREFSEEQVRAANHRKQRSAELRSRLSLLGVSGSHSAVLPK
jgi:hypothetical protein